MAVPRVFWEFERLFVLGDDVSADMSPWPFAEPRDPVPADDGAAVTRPAGAARPSVPATGNVLGHRRGAQLWVEGGRLRLLEEGQWPVLMGMSEFESDGSCLQTAF